MPTLLCLRREVHRRRPNQSAKCARRKAMRPMCAGTALRRTSSPIPSLLELRPPTTATTPIGTPIVGATDHITAELEKLTVRDKYKGADQVHTASGLGMRISNIGHAILHTPNKNLHLQNVLHVPSANKNLVSIHRLTSDNNTYVEFHPHHFFIKDRATKKTIHQGRCEGGLYPLRPQEVGAHHHKQACGVSRPSTWIWHSRLGHSLRELLETICFQGLLVIMLSRCVTLVKRQRVIDFLILAQKIKVVLPSI